MEKPVAETEDPYVESEDFSFGEIFGGKTGTLVGGSLAAGGIYALIEAFTSDRMIEAISGSSNVFIFVCIIAILAFAAVVSRYISVALQNKQIDLHNKQVMYFGEWGNYLSSQNAEIIEDLESVVENMVTAGDLEEAMENLAHVTMNIEEPPPEGGTSDGE
jgi:hypothetical protein